MALHGGSVTWILLRRHLCGCAHSTNSTVIITQTPKSCTVTVDDILITWTVPTQGFGIFCNINKYC